MPTTIFQPIHTSSSDPDVVVQGTHTPAELVRQSGVWIDTAGSAFLSQEEYMLAPSEAPLWLVAEEDSFDFCHGDMKITLQRGECVIVPARTEGCTLRKAKDARILWLILTGPLMENFMRQMNAYNRLPARQGMLPTQVGLIRQIVQVVVRHMDTADASFQLQQLLWALLAAHCGQSVANSATLSYEIARVVDAMRAGSYKDSFSLAEMAAISRMPVETFRKRFTAELGIPPLGYLQFLKMERAKSLLRSGVGVRQTGVEIGMPDPYHFSKQFKHVVGMSPTAYLKHVGGKGEAADPVDVE
ncbi:MAG: helix-turn-helix transcriptional regulator [Clostridia bacterium]|nr:helix-turn-helix transcriptional regulator [Clostridia bacterium]MBP3648922.1 helix-turn-helix transcriptional regulator [Clostridia bacterium]